MKILFTSLIALVVAAVNPVLAEELSGSIEYLSPDLQKAEVQHNETDLDFTARNVKDNDCDDRGDCGTEPVTADMFLKIDDIKGESNDSSDVERPDFTLVPDRIEAVRVEGGDVDSDDDDFGDIGERLDSDDDGDSLGTEDDTAREAKSSKPKEIVVVGSKIHEAIAKGVEIRGWDPTKKEVILKTEDIKTDEDVSDYATALLASDNDVSSISVHENTIGLTFDRPVKLFGLIRVAMEHKVEVSTNPDEVGRVKVRFPWWSFLAKKDFSSDEIKASVEENITNSNNETEDNQEDIEEFQNIGNTMKVLHDTAMAIIRKVG